MERLQAAPRAESGLLDGVMMVSQPGGPHPRVPLPLQPPLHSLFSPLFPTSVFPATISLLKTCPVSTRPQAGPWEHKESDTVPLKGNRGDAYKWGITECEDKDPWVLATEGSEL